MWGMIDPTKTKTGYKRDAEGQWWFYPKRNRPRVRCHIKVCHGCGEEYVVSPFVAAQSKFCSRACSIEAQRGKLTAKGSESWQWKGGKTMRRGYVYVFAPDHPVCQGNGRKYVAEHRLVMEKKLGRYLKSTEYVHHVDGDKLNNDPANLEIIGGSEHAKRHWIKRNGEPPHCPTCTCGR